MKPELPQPQAFERVLKRRAVGDGHERVVPLELGVNCGGGAPCPSLFRDEHNAWLGFYAIEWTDPGMPEGDDTTALLQFEGCQAVNLGFPNVDVLHGHRLWPKGLGFYGSFEVINSQWIASLDQIETVFPTYDPTFFGGARHFVLTFHDSVFECIAQRVTVTGHARTLHDLMAAVVEQATAGTPFPWTPTPGRRIG